MAHKRDIRTPLTSCHLTCKRSPMKKVKLFTDFLASAWKHLHPGKRQQSFCSYEPVTSSLYTTWNWPKHENTWNEVIKADENSAITTILNPTWTSKRHDCAFQTKIKLFHWIKQRWTIYEMQTMAMQTSCLAVCFVVSVLLTRFALHLKLTSVVWFCTKYGWKDKVDRCFSTEYYKCTNLLLCRFS